LREQSGKPTIKILVSLALGLGTLALYLPAIGHAFIDFDDQQYVTENLHIQSGFTWQTFQWAFGFHVSNWHPLTWLAHVLDFRLYGLHAGGHHFTNALLHAANTLFLFLALNRMTGAMWRSAVVAALFGWHPLHVESVAWVAERKDVLSGFFFMLTVWAYDRRQETGDGRQETAGAGGVISNQLSVISYQWVALVFFALGLMSKAMLVTVPFVLLLLDYWPLGRGGGRGQGSGFRTFVGLVVEKIPFFLLSAVSCVLTVIAQQKGFAVVSVSGLPISRRLGHALVSYVHYLGATFWPSHLAVFYPYDLATPLWQIAGAGALLVVVTVVALVARRWPYLAVGWFWYLGMLVPVIGLMQVGEQAWADRYTYLPSIGLFLAVVWGIADVLKSVERRSVEGGASGAVHALSRFHGLTLLTLAVLVVCTTKQLGYWRNTETLFRHTVQVTRNNFMAVSVLGSIRAKEGKLEEAINYYQTALRYNPAYPEAHFLLGNALDQQGKLDPAIVEYRQALRFQPTQEQAHLLLGVALARQNKVEEAAAHYLTVLKTNPESAVGHNNLARLLHTQGRTAEAAEHYLAAVKLNPGLAEAHNNLGVLFLQEGKVAEGASHLREACRLNPQSGEARYNLALALNQLEKWNEAAELFAGTVDAASTDANAHYQYGLALAHLGQTRHAVSQYASALLLKGDFAEALNALAWILATDPRPEYRNKEQAVQMAEQACELTHRARAAYLATLAAAYGRSERFP